jgi:glycosyltransferase involved in cell wall biosynthesis
MPNIALEAGPLHSGDSVRGVGVYVRELLPHLKNVEAVDINSEDFNSNKYNLLHLTSFNPFRPAVPFKAGKIKKILTIYDLIPLIYSSNYPPGIKGRINWELNNYSINNSVNAVITISETSKKDICRYTGINPDKVFVTYLAPRVIFKHLAAGGWEDGVIKKYNLPKKFALYVGDVNYNKNIPNLVKAAKIARIPLLIAGKRAAEINTLPLTHPELKHLNNIDWRGVILPGFVPDTDLVKIYNLASVYVQPSFYEGFGLPLVEAVSCGIPVAVSKNQCHVEILGSSLKYFDPYNTAEIAEALISPNKNIILPRDYSWKITAEETLKLYDQILG